MQDLKEAEEDLDDDYAWMVSLQNELAAVDLPRGKLHHYRRCWARFGLNFSTYYDCCTSQHYISFHDGMIEYWSLQMHQMCRNTGRPTPVCSFIIADILATEARHRPLDRY